jgi:heat shock protein HspQ
MASRKRAAPRFCIGQVVHHQRFGYRGVIYDIDLEFSLSEEWYEAVARSRPPKDAPWYRVLVHGAAHETYVAERHLETDSSGAPVEHPALGHHFDEFRGDHYARTGDRN